MPHPPNFKPDPSIRFRAMYRLIMAAVQLSAYATAGFPVVAIASRRAEKAAEVTKRLVRLAEFGF
ncbi:MAG: hypothetical protein JO066_15990 [Verrucomicrobia bacterium]|nr:hypothetical protein [Verrucomicrobiota bacterium]